MRIRLRTFDRLMEVLALSSALLSYTYTLVNLSEYLNTYERFIVVMASTVAAIVLIVLGYSKLQSIKISSYLELDVIGGLTPIVMSSTLISIAVYKGIVDLKSLLYVFIFVITMAIIYSEILEREVVIRVLMLSITVSLVLALHRDVVMLILLPALTVLAIVLGVDLLSYAILRIEKSLKGVFIIGGNRALDAIVLSYSLTTGISSLLSILLG